MKNLKKIRKQHNMTQERLAAILGVEKSSVSKWETTDIIPDLEKLRKLVKLFNITYDDLLSDDK
ncbi:TPA: helix-turn-helix transcriptional regulator [bacterium]|jgi:transcriptional regulator with XRE-family HTH domain|nr:helix-turn-helix transcriptional regulator [bacterium]